MCVYIHIHIHMYVYLCVYIYIHIHIYMYVHVCLYICICVYIYIYRYAYMRGWCPLGAHSFFLEVTNQTFWKTSFSSLLANNGDSNRPPGAAAGWPPPGGGYIYIYIYTIYIYIYTCICICPLSCKQLDSPATFDHPLKQIGGCFCRLRRETFFNHNIIIITSIIIIIINIINIIIHSYFSFGSIHPRELAERVECGNCAGRDAEGFWSLGQTKYYIKEVAFLSAPTNFLAQWFRNVDSKILGLTILSVKTDRRVWQLCRKRRISTI